MKVDNKIVRKFFIKFSIFSFEFSTSPGFTLIELLVVFAIVGLLTALGIAAYNSYNSSQTVASSATDVATMLNTAKSRSLTQVIPSICATTPVTGYQVDVAINAQQYTLSVVCGIKHIITTNSLPPNVTFANGSTSSVFFTISDGTVASNASISVTGYGKTKTITVSQTGNVSSN